MAHGGRREGAGRRPGAVTKRTREIADRAVAEGKTPLEVMLDNMRHFQQVALDAEAMIEGLTADEFIGAVTDMTPEQQFKELLAQVKKAAGLRLMAQECARDAAAYMHARLSSTETKSEVVHRYVADVPEIAKTVDEWQRVHGPKLLQ